MRMRSLLQERFAVAARFLQTKSLLRYGTEPGLRLENYMVSITDPADAVMAVANSVSRLMCGHLGPEERNGLLDALANRYAEETDVSHPFAPVAEARLRTRQQVREHFAAAGSQSNRLRRFDPVDAVVHRTSDPELIIFEFAYAAATAEQTHMVRSIYVVRVRNGEIVESRDYTDHIGLARAFGRLDSLVGHLAKAST